LFLFTGVEVVLERKEGCTVFEDLEQDDVQLFQGLLTETGVRDGGLRNQLREVGVDLGDGGVALVEQLTVDVGVHSNLFL
jgi:hypothetical protein